MAAGTITANALYVSRHIRFNNGECAESTTYASKQVSTYSHVSPDRPTRRVKPSNPLLHPTSYGPFSKGSQIARHEEWYRKARLLCGGKYVDATIKDGFLTMPSHSWTWPTVDPWEIDMRNKIKDDQICMADTIGEWRETADAVSGGVKALRKAMRYIRKYYYMPRRSWPKALKRDLINERGKLTLDNVRTAYLGTLFGVMPWLTLANDSQMALERRLALPITRRFRVTKKAEKVSTSVGVSGGEFIAQMSKTTRTVLRVQYKVENGVYTAGNPAEALWASLPLSFMFDYFIGIGEWLSAIDALTGVESIIGTTTTRYRGTFVDRRLNSVVKTKDNIGTLVSPGSGYSRTYQRTVVTSIGLPLTLSYKMTSDLGKLTSAVAILIGFRRNPEPPRRR